MFSSASSILSAYAPVKALTVVYKWDELNNHFTYANTRNAYLWIHKLEILQLFTDNNTKELSKNNNTLTIHSLLIRFQHKTGIWCTRYWSKIYELSKL